MTLCGHCGCTREQAALDAMVLGLEDEFRARVYTCCQIAAWADEQWLAWAEASLYPAVAVAETEANEPAWFGRKLCPTPH